MRDSSAATGFLPSFLPSFALTLLLGLLPLKSVAATPVLPLGTDPGVTGAQPVAIDGQDVAAQLNALIVGQGVVGVTVPEAILPDGGAIVWAVVRDESDDLGMRHRFYRQYFRPGPRLSQTLEPPYSTSGLEMAGAELGVHTIEDYLATAFGTQFRELILVNEPTIARSAKALEIAKDSLSAWPGFEPPDWFVWPTDASDTQVSSLRLVLRSLGDGRSFRFTWELIAIDWLGEPQAVLMDATTGALLAVESRRMNDRCAPNPGYAPVTAIVVPQHTPLIPNRSVKASPDTAVEGFTHEAYWPVTSWGIPSVEVYFGIYPPDSPLRCPLNWHGDPNFPLLYGLTHVKTITGTVQFDNWTSPDVPGRAAGDAMWFARETMAQLKNFNRYGWDGAGSPARVVVDDRCTATKNAEWVNYDTRCGPASNHVGIGLRADPQSYSFAASLDVIAHEFGHGVIQTSANWPYSGDGAQLHEGFADFIGYMTEWYRQPTGCSWECADWKIGEDSGFMVRRVDQDDGLPANCCNPDLITGKHAYHRLDPVCTCPETGHYRGNMLGVAYRLMANVPGPNQNPVCGRTWYSGCEINVPAIGVDKASRILFRVLTYYATSTTSWWTLPDLGKAAAYDLYKNCTTGYSALPEQQSFEKAFLAIGYSGITGYHTCL